MQKAVEIMIQFHVYPGGKKRIVTFSYDDGDIRDARLVELFNTYGVKGTFHLNGKKFLSATEEELAEIRNRYAGHEISCHTLSHGFPARMPGPSVIAEVLEDRRILEKIAGYPVIGMSYPSGSYNADVIAAMRACGIVYSRAANNTNAFRLPSDFMEWQPTCHHKNALPLCFRTLQKMKPLNKSAKSPCSLHGRFIGK